MFLDLTFKVGTRNDKFYRPDIHNCSFEIKSRFPNIHIHANKQALFSPELSLNA